jgi:hypothetical protein
VSAAALTDHLRDNRHRRSRAAGTHFECTYSGGRARAQRERQQGSRRLTQGEARGFHEPRLLRGQQRPVHVALRGGGVTDVTEMRFACRRPWV